MSHSAYKLVIIDKLKLELCIDPTDYYVTYRYKRYGDDLNYLDCVHVAVPDHDFYRSDQFFDEWAKASGYNDFEKFLRSDDFNKIVDYIDGSGNLLPGWTSIPTIDN